jgi:hypothetical protein
MRTWRPNLTVLAPRSGGSPSRKMTRPPTEAALFFSLGLKLGYRCLGSFQYTGEIKPSFCCSNESPPVSLVMFRLR